MPEDAPPTDEGALEIRLLGGFRLSLGARTIEDTDWRRRKPKTLVKLLALAPRHELHREQLLDALWPELAPDAAANNLYQALHVVRRAVDPAGRLPFLHLRDEIVALRPPGPLLIDVEAFEAATARAKATGQPRAYRAAIDLYAGDLLPEDRFDDWAAGPRERLRQTRFALLTELAALLEAAGDVAGATAVLSRAVEADPLHEPATRGLMRLHALAGDRRSASRVYERLSSALRRDLDDDPDAQSQRLHDQIAAGIYPPDRGSPTVAVGAASAAPSPPSAPVSSPTNLPVQLTSFVGRTRAIDDGRRLLAAGRLLTLTGPGGVGKTRLALATAATLRDRFPDGVWLAELSPLADPGLVPQVVAAAVGVREAPNQAPFETLSRELRGKRLLLVLDNCEHLIEACTALADGLLRAAPEVRILATSREPLRVGGEVTWPVPSLSLPDRTGRTTVDDLLNSEAARLFTERASAARPNFTIGESEVAAVAEICHRLDGLPLAVELAASRVRVLPVAQIAERLDDRLRLLGGGARTAPTRQQTLRATLDWSYDLLTDAERTVLARVAVFAGGFSLDAAETVCAGAGIVSDAVFDLLLQLVDKSLVVAEASGDVARYRLLETIRQYAAERLAAGDDRRAVHDRHTRYFLNLAESAEPGLKSGERDRWLARLRTEHDNIRAALEWSLADRDQPAIGLRLASALAWFWQVGNHHSEGRRWFDAALPRGDIDRRTRASMMALNGAGMLAVMQGDIAAGRGWLDEGLAAAMALGDRHGVASARVWSVWPSLFQGRHADARRAAEKALSTFRDLDEPWHVALALTAVGFVGLETRDLDTAAEAFAEALRIFRALGEPWGTAASVTEIARVAYRRSAFAEARAAVDEVIALHRAMADKWLLAQSLGLAVEIARAQGDAAVARQYGEESLALSADVGQHSHVAWSRRNLGYLAFDRGEIEAATAHFAAGLETFRQRAYPIGVACCLTGMAVTESPARPRLAIRLFAAADALLIGHGAELAPADRIAADRALAAIRAAVPSGEFDEEWAGGRSLTAEQAAIEATASRVGDATVTASR